MPRQLHLYISEDLERDLKAFADSHHEFASLAAVVRFALAKFLSEQTGKS